MFEGGVITDVGYGIIRVLTVWPSAFGEKARKGIA